MAIYKRIRSIRGFQTRGGNYIVCVDYAGHIIWLRYADVFLNRAALSAYFEERGAPVFHPEYAVFLKKEVKAMEDWGRGNYLDYVGWTGGHFSLPDGHVTSPPQAKTAKMEMREVGQRCRAVGSLGNWQKEVALRLTGQTLPMLAIMAMFAPPIMRFSNFAGNALFEVVGPSGSYKVALLKVAASVIGRPQAATGNTYWVRFYDLINALDRELLEHADLPLLVADVDFDFIGRPPNHQVNTVRPLADALKEASHSNRGNQPAGRFLMLTTGRDPMTKLVGGGAVEKLSEGRVHTLMLSEDHGLGIFDRLPPDDGGSFDFALQLVTAADRSHGTPMRAFLDQLVRAAADDRQALRAQVGRYMGEFRKHCGLMPHDEVGRQQADAFGLIFAAGKIAQAYKILPTEWKCGPAVLRWYRRARIASVGRQPLGERLDVFARRKGVAHIGSGQRSLTRKEAACHDVFVRHRSDGLQIAIRRKTMRRLIPDWMQLQDRRDVRQIMDFEKDKVTRRVRLSKGAKSTPMYNFWLKDKARS